MLKIYNYIFFRKYFFLLNKNFLCIYNDAKAKYDKAKNKST